MSYREELARRYGFSTFAELLVISERLSGADRGQVKSYIARRPNGTWFVWEDAPLLKYQKAKETRQDDARASAGGQCFRSSFSMTTCGR